MQYKNFVPRILLCGDDAEFFAQVFARAFKIVGRLKILGEVDGQKFNIARDGKVFLNGKLQDFDALKKILSDGSIDYLVFTQRKMFQHYHAYAYGNDFFTPRAITLEQFNKLPREIFYDANIPLKMLAWLKRLNVKTALDVDGFFAASKIFTNPSNDLTEIDCVTEKPLPPIAENIYRHVYKNLAEVGRKKYDAVILAEREPSDFESAFLQLENFSDSVITFGRTNGALKKHLSDNARTFAQGAGLRIETGDLFYLTRRKPPEDFCVYVVTYKNIKLDEPPEGYKIIQAGHAVNADTGYLGDDTGDNISDLNLYLNELTALYWMWKNTTHTIIGLNHYRRFFTEGDETFSRDKILTKQAALKILETHDIIVSRTFHGILNQREFVENDCGEKLAKVIDTIFRKHLLHTQPDYMDALDFVFNAKAIYRSHLFITRREILDAYCKWLFSFLIDVTKETLKIVPLDKMSFTPRRLVAFYAERMLHVWLTKQRLRIKELNFMFIEGI